jgi:prepilin-type processing-associated H-X9-DG protein
LILNYAFGDLGLFVGIIISMAGMPLALIFGIVALNKIRAAGGRITGRGLAISGLFMGGVSFLLLAAMFFPALRSAREKDHRSQCLNNLKQIGVAIGIYAKEHDGNIPRTFDDLRPYATNLGKLLICPSARDRSHPSYQIVLEGKKWNSDETMDAIVVTEPFSNHRTGRMVLYGDGHVSYNFDSAKSD